MLPVVGGAEGAALYWRAEPAGFGFPGQRQPRSREPDRRGGAHGAGRGGGSDGGGEGGERRGEGEEIE